MILVRFVAVGRYARAGAVIVSPLALSCLRPRVSRLPAERPVGSPATADGCAVGGWGPAPASRQRPREPEQARPDSPGS